MSNVSKLIVRKMSTDAIPAGGGLAAGLQFLSSTASIRKGWLAAKEWVEAALAVVRASPDSPYKDDEAIAGEILRQLEEKDHARRRSSRPTGVVGNGDH